MRWVLIVAVAAFLSVGCSAPDARDPDVRFSLEMITHHRQTIKLADMVQGQSTDPYVTSLAARLKATERTEIDVMSTWLSMWNVPLPDGSSYQMPGNVTTAQFNELRGKQGRAFDQMWLNTMSKHFSSAITIAQMALATGQHAPTGDLARRIIREKREKITEIDQQLARVPASV